MTINWLHLSDVHECDKEGYHRAAMYDAIVAEVKDYEKKPDLVFITGDLAFSGTTEEYESLKKRFFDKLSNVLPGTCPIFIVPGNHGVDRKAVVPPRLWIIDAEQRKLFQEVGASGLRKRRELLLPRFDAYRSFERTAAAWDADWLASQRGSICKLLMVDGRRISIIGINTAWLCQDEDDWSELTAGRTMVDAALREAEKSEPELLIVLGHHPLQARSGERTWSDGNFIRARLEQSNAIYLHGHLHSSGDQRSGDSLESCLAIQAPSAFQAGDSTVWRNGIMWGEADIDNGWLIVKPLKWNDGDREYKFDSDAGLNRNRVAGRDAFRLPLPARASPTIGTDTEKTQDLPAGWRIVEKEALATRTAERPDVRVMIDYFDGSQPDWRVALADGIQPRQIVEGVVSRFRRRHSGAVRPLVELLTGAGGEGKSTALLHVAATLVRDATQNWTCLYREAAAAEIAPKMFDRLEHREDHAWIIAVDDAENVGKELSAELRRITPRTDVHLLLAAREADWAIRELTREVWREIADFRQEPISGLDEVDARRIVEGWRAYGDEAMGRLHGSSVESAAKALAGHANEHAARSGEGALLGALLFTRQGEDLKDRVRTFLAPLAGRGGINGFDLRDIYAMIAAMHAENQLYLSRDVLAFTLGCQDDELDLELRVLRREAMLDSGETYILTRHRRIAETACEVLREDGYDLNKWYPHREFVQRRSRNPDIAKWDFDLARHFVTKGSGFWALARNVAKALSETQGHDPSLLSAYSKVLRETNVPGDAMALLKAKGEFLRFRRDILYEWSVVAGEVSDPGLNAWLAGRALADGGSPLTNRNCSLALAGLGRAFELLHNNNKNPIFKEAQIGCGRLGLRLPGLDPTGRRFFERHVGGPEGSIGQKVPPESDVQLLQRAVIAATEEMEPDNDPPFFESFLGDPDGYRYSDLLRTITDNTTAKSA